MRSRNLLLLFLCLSFHSLFAQQDLQSKIPVDPQVKTGKLANGLTYYIRQNHRPAQKVELRLVVNAGSVLENENQQGIAHLSEHMAFNGTTHFKKNDIISFLQSIGVGFGSDLNAYTGFNETVYILPIPTDKPGNIEKGFQILEDWAHNVTYNDDDIDGERPVVLEESRMGKGANDRMQKKILPGIFAGSLYADRLPIGIDSIIQHASYETVKSFYKEWYRPDLMAVIVVGDMDPLKAEALIKKHFSGLKNPAGEKERFNVTVPPYKQSEAQVVTDKEATSYVYRIYYSAQKTEPVLTLADYKKDLVKYIFTNLFNQRLRELSQQENPPFINAGSGFGSEARGYEAFTAYIAAGNSDSLGSLKAFEQELQRAIRFDFTQKELDRVKASLLNNIQRAVNEKDKTESSGYADEYISNFLEREPVPGVVNEAKYYKELLPQISLDDVNAIGKKLGENQYQFIALTGPEAGAAKILPTPEQILAVSAETNKMELSPYQEKELAASLLEKTPVPGKVTATRQNTVLGTTELTLSNGITVTVKHTDFKNDEILMSAVRAGGKNNYGIADKYNAQYLVPVITAMGVGNFSPVDLRKVLSGKTVSAAPYFTDVSEGFGGSSSVKDLESMLQLVYLYTTAPRIDTALFRSFVQKNKAQFGFLRANPQAVFVDSFFNVLYHHDPLMPLVVPKPEYFDELSLSRIMQMYKERFENAYGMHFTFVGNITAAGLKPLLEKYLGALPTTKATFAYMDNKVRQSPGEINVTLHLGKEPKALIIKMYHGEQPYSDALDLKGQAVSEVLNIRVIEELREKIQGIYSGGTQFEFSKLPYPNYTLTFQLPCGPEKLDTLLQASRAEVERIIKEGPSASDLAKVKEQWKEQYKTSVKENRTWLSQLQSFYFEGYNPDYFLNYNKYVDALTPRDIQEAARLLLSSKNIATGILLPEEK